MTFKVFGTGCKCNTMCACTDRHKILPFDSSQSSASALGWRQNARVRLTWDVQTADNCRERRLFGVSLFLRCSRCYRKVGTHFYEADPRLYRVWSSSLPFLPSWVFLLVGNRHWFFSLRNIFPIDGGVILTTDCRLASLLLFQGCVLALHEYLQSLPEVKNREKSDAQHTPKSFAVS